MTVRESAWVSAHAFYHDELDPLLVEVVAPLVDKLQADGMVDAYFFLRYWDGGTHLRLRVLPADPARRGEIQRLLSHGFTTFFAARPASTWMRQEEYAALAPALARWERMTSWTQRLHPNNSLAFIPYRREHHRYGNGATIEAVERHFTESSRIALQLLTAGMSPAQRSTAAAAMLLLAWFCAEPDVTALSRRLKTGDPRRLPGLPDGGEPQPGARDEQDGHRVADIARRVRTLAAAAPDLPDGGTLAAWARSMACLRDTLDAHIAAGTFTPPAQGWDGPGGVAPGPGSSLPVLDITAHLVCNRLGVAPVHEARLRQLAALAVAALAEEGG